MFEKYSKRNFYDFISLVGAELLHADGQTDRYVEANSHFSQLP